MKLSRKVNKSVSVIESLLTRGITEVIDRNELKKALLSGKKLRIKLGIDPTSPELHIGHSVVLRKLRLFQDLGHTAVLIIGDFTAIVGDPSGKSKTRAPLTKLQVRQNMKTYWKQAQKILSKKNLEIRYNSEWLSKLDFPHLFDLAGLISLNQILEREDFKKRLQSQQSIRMYELFYPLLQAYDSVMTKADVELGGNDQLFNLLMGRTLMERMHITPQNILTTDLLEGTDGKEKMSKSLGNYIAVTDKPNDMFGKVMAVRDELISKYFLLCTDVEEKDIKEIENQIKSGKMNPRDAKLRLAQEIVAFYHGDKKAEVAKKEFIKVFTKKDFPTRISEFELPKSVKNIVDVLIETKLAPSRSQARRLLVQGGVKVDGKVIKDSDYKISETSTIQVGKRHFAKVSYKR